MNCKVSKRRIAGIFAAGAAALAVTTSADAQTRVYPTDVVNVVAAANGGRVLGATSTFEDSAEWDAKNLIDGQVYDPVKTSGSFGWSSNKYDPITMDAVTFGFGDGETKRIGKIVLNPATPLAPERWAKDVEIQVSNQTAEGPYRTAGIVTLRREARPQTFLIFPVEAKYVRLVFRSNQGSDRAVALGEVEMYEAISTADPTGQLIASMEQAVAELKQYRELEVRRRNSGSVAQNSDPQNLQNVAGEAATISGATLQLIQMAVPEERALFPVSNVNIAAAKNGGKIMFYSSLFSNDTTFSATNLIDGKIFNPRDPKAAGSSAGWASEGFVPGREFVTIGFGDDRTHLIGKIVLNPASNQSPLRWARRVEVQVTSGSAKDGPWRTVQTLNLRPDPVNQEFFIDPVEAKYVRFIFQANGPEDINLPGITPGVNSDRAVSLGEIELYEATAATDALDAVIGRFENILLNMKKLYSEQMKTTGGTTTVPKNPVSDL
jgi:hypothetical protein